MAYSKGQLITMNLDGTDREYRILKLDGNIAEVVCMSSVGKSTFGSDRTYAGSSLDTYLNTTWYNKLTAAAKAAIVSKTFTQDSWYWGTSGSPVYSGNYGDTVPGTSPYSISKGSDTYGAQITRNVYALSVQDVLDYIMDTGVGDGKLENYNIWKMFWDTTTPPSTSEYLWLRSADANRAISAWRVVPSTGVCAVDNVLNDRAVRPALTVDLSKILPPQLDTPQNVTASGTVVSFDPVENATSYAVLADGSEIGTVEGAVTDELAGTWVFNDNLEINANFSYTLQFISNNTAYEKISVEGYEPPPFGLFGDLCYDDGIVYYDSTITWEDESYKTITITSKLSEVTNGDTLLAWLQANATKQ